MCNPTCSFEKAYEQDVSDMWLDELRKSDLDTFEIKAEGKVKAKSKSKGKVRGNIVADGQEPGVYASYGSGSSSSASAAPWVPSGRLPGSVKRARLQAEDL